MPDPAVLTALGSATLYEASGLPSALDHAIRPVWLGAATAGPAYPLRCAPNDNLAIHLAMEHAPAGSVLVIDAGGHIGGYWGEVLTAAAEARGVIGLVIDGGVRDVAAMARRGFPAFARGISVRGTIKNAAPSVGRPIVVAGVTVAPGDWVVADEDGVVVLPADRADTIAKAGQERADKETGMMERLAEGATMVELLGLEDRRGLVG